MNILILGSGGREHTFAWKIAQSPLCKSLYVAPGNAGSATVAKNIDLDISDFELVLSAVNQNEIDLLIVGPEAPLVDGLADYLGEHSPGLKVIGPKKEGAQLEGSKVFAKYFMKDFGIPTASYFEVRDDNLQEGIDHLRMNEGPYVLKADGLAAGKGVLIIENTEEAIDELKRMIDGKFGRASARVVIEEFLDGIEFSVFVLTDGQYYTMLPAAKDYKRIGEGDTGLNTGGMGAISPVSFLDDELIEKVKDQIVLPTLGGLRKRGLDYVGFIFFGLINVGGEPYVIEYNCRMGDPETQVVLPRMQNDLVELFISLFDQKLYEVPLQVDPRHAAAVVAVSGGYPGAYEKGKRIEGLGENKESIVFHAGTKKTERGVETNGGRVLAVTSYGDSIAEAVDKSIATAEGIEFEGRYFRRDIGFDL